MERRRQIKRTRYLNCTKGVWAVALSTCCVISAANADQTAVLIAARYGVRTASIETIGTLFDNSTEVGGGSGILIGNKFVLTNNHIVPFEINYRKLVINVRLQSRAQSPMPVTNVQRDAQYDLALLELAAPVQGVAGSRCPMPVIGDPDEAPMGASLYLLGFPLNQDLSISGGLISNQGPDRWQTDTVINPGNSGGPVFNENQALLGLAVGGIVNWNTGGGQSVRVSGVNFIIPALTIMKSSIFPTIQSIPAPDSCWTPWATAKIHPTNKEHLIKYNIDLSSNIPSLTSSLKKALGETAEVRISRQDMPYLTNAPVDQLPLPELLRRTYTVSETKDDHPVLAAPSSREYNRQFKAESSYRIIDCAWHAVTANHSSGELCRINDSGTAATFSFGLTSGPQFDRYRGWLGGTLTLTQKLSAR